MNPNYATIFAASPDDQRGLFLECAQRLGTSIQNVEKDFWVCWTLDALFNGLPAGSPRLLFKGGTSLSKSFGLISRFSEDIDITVFREDLGQAVDVPALEAMGTKARGRQLDAIRVACQAYIAHTLGPQLQALADKHVGPMLCSVELDPDDPDQQTLLLHYPAVSDHHHYVRHAVKIEAGAKSALDPHTLASVTPYIAKQIADTNLQIAGITTVEPSRTLWDKIVILHGLRQWYTRRNELRQDGNRISRHYYDLHRLIQSADAQAWSNNRGLGQDCARHADLFFGRPDYRLDLAQPGSFTLVPVGDMTDRLHRDYEAMLGMVFGDAPTFDDVMHSIEVLEQTINLQQ